MMSYDVCTGNGFRPPILHTNPHKTNQHHCESQKMYLFARAFPIIIALMAAPLQIEAGSVSYTGAVTPASPEWDRPIGGGPLISSGGPVGYSVQEFYVDTDGTFDIGFAISSTQTYDGYIHVYEVSFDPTDQLTNLLDGDDDGPGGTGTSDLTVALNEGVQYFLVTSAFSNGDYGSFTNTITGPTDDATPILGLIGARSVSYTGEVTPASPKWNRPDVGGPTIIFVGPVGYSVQEFYVDTDGAFNIGFAISSTQTYDGYIYVYEESFDPTDQLTNLLAENDDGSGGVGTSYLTVTLNEGVQYFLVTSAFSGGDYGSFTNTIIGPTDEATPILGLIPCFECATNNPCSRESIAANGGFYFPHCILTKFVQCDNHGGCFDMPCAPGTVWDASRNTCNFP